eukprot:scaffold5569_cov116-Isochrysis_galbana.AAC.5
MRTVTTATGAYLRSSACVFRYFASLEYFDEACRRDVDFFATAASQKGTRGAAPRGKASARGRGIARGETARERHRLG